MRVLWILGARRRLKEIEAETAKDSPQASRGMVERLLRLVQTLSEPPLIGRRLAKYDPEDVREWLERPYRVIFRVKPGSGRDRSVLHYRQLMPTDLAGLRDA